MEFKQITEDEWDEKFKPIKNPFSDDKDMEMFETFGKEYEYVKKINAEEPGRVWTYLDGDEFPAIVDGWAFINRIGYYITEVPCPGDVGYEIKVGDYDNE